MSKYYCKCCNYDAKVKGNYTKHLKTNKHKNIQIIQSQTGDETSTINLLYNTCKYCKKNFTTKQAMYRHIKYVCNQNSDESIIELCRLLNEKDRRQ